MNPIELEQRQDTSRRTINSHRQTRLENRGQLETMPPVRSPNAGLGGLGFVIALTLLLMRPAAAQTYSIDWHTIDGGGGTSTGGVYAVSGTIGQPDTGKISGGNFSVSGGYWAFASAVQTPGAPTLTIFSSNPGQATISWTPATPGFVLQEKTSTATTNWVNSSSGATNPIVVPATLPAKFYRLFKP